MSWKVWFLFILVFGGGLEKGILILNEVWFMFEEECCLIGNEVFGKVLWGIY